LQRDAADGIGLPVGEEKRLAQAVLASAKRLVEDA
jgi:hypothetical protein